MTRRLIDLTEQELGHWLEALAAAMESIMPAARDGRSPAPFAVFVFDDPGLAHYCSNVDRGAAFDALRSILGSNAGTQGGAFRVAADAARAAGYEVGRARGVSVLFDAGVSVCVVPDDSAERGWRVHSVAGHDDDDA